jgi:hypothetical protein
VGRVTDAQGRPVAGARVKLSVSACAPCLQGGSTNRDTETNRDGEYAFVNKAPATYGVQIAARSGTTLLFWRRRDVTLALGAVARVDAVLEPLRVQIILRTYRPDGRIESTATTSSPIPNAFAWADPVQCTALTSGMPRRLGPTPSVGWRVTSRVLGAADEALSVRVDWQRLWDQGESQSKPQTGTLETRIPLGERRPLDFGVLPPSKACPVSAARLEVAVVPPAATVVNDERADALRAARIASRAGSASEQLGRIRDGLPSERSDALRQALEARQADGKRDGGRQSLPASPLSEAEIWLVHKLPDGSERSELIRQPLRETASFVFPSIRLTSSGTAFDLEVFGFIRRLIADDGAVSLQVAIGQRQAGIGTTDSYSGSGKVVSWPGPAEVLAFELPSDSRLPAGHRFDLRLRLTPR